MGSWDHRGMANGKGGFSMAMWEYGLKTGDLAEEEMVKRFEKALTRAAKATSDPHIAKSRKKLRKNTGPFGRSTPDSEPPDYDHIYFFNSGRRGCHLFLKLYPNMERNGRIKFPREGVTWCMYLDFSYGRDLPPEILADLEVEKPEEYGENFMRELSQFFPHEIVLLKEYEYFRWENGQDVHVVPREAAESGGQD